MPTPKRSSEASRLPPSCWIALAGVAGGDSRPAWDASYRRRPARCRRPKSAGWFSIVHTVRENSGRKSDSPRRALRPRLGACMFPELPSGCLAGVGLGKVGEVSGGSSSKLVPTPPLASPDFGHATPWRREMPACVWCAGGTEYAVLRPVFNWAVAWQDDGLLG